MPPSNVLQGPRIASWTCHSCRTAVPRLLPTGEHNRQRLNERRMLLPDPQIQAALAGVPGPRAGEICVACADTYQELLGSLIRPPWEDGDPRASPGLNDTGIIGALLPIAGRGTRVLIFHAVDGTLVNTECEDLHQLIHDRLTYPGSRGAIAPRVWALYQCHLADRYAASVAESPPRDHPR
ncbi:hypothetical protein [Thioalkalivibrio paradoxus]|uniref:Uncharacterized protein n=1 Tax=Thioalkalivibrio paradoxus ARh 1 TaxID=713585 RepID=W0DJ87_9GAMM|nr:hypothetical protein [Thioalkalivibrio paradoxus]AHE97297.1 hypothetical protein THITH_02330 [Thioalkalivibrio paradoxus ARh 1]